MKITTMATGLLFPEGPVALSDGDVLVRAGARYAWSRRTTARSTSARLPEG